MTTTLTTGDAVRMAWGGNQDPSVPKTKAHIHNLPAVIARAAHLYRQTVYSSRAVAAVSFFVAAALAAGNHGNPPSVMFSLLALALLNAGPSSYLARHRFRAEIEKAALKAGYSAEDARRSSVEIFKEWSASPLDVVTT
jgi:hypothetical protein